MKDTTKKLHSIFGEIRNIRYTPRRKDGTKGVSFEFKTKGIWTKGSYSYLSDIR